MGGAKMMNKKAVVTVTTLFIALICTLALFYAGYEYIEGNYETSGITDTLGYNDSYDKLQESQSKLNDSISEIQTAGQNIAEADASALFIAWNGLKGLAATITAFFKTISVATNVFNAIFPALFFLPTWVKVLAQMGLVITIVLLIIGAFKGETKT